MLSLKTSTEVALELANRIRKQRLSRNWTQAELAARAGLKLPTYVLFERTGRIALLRLLKVLDVLGLLDEFDQFARKENLAGLTLNDITRPERKRGGRRQS
jgi:transcriptional regulator with XRE-family HTH domain